MLPWNACLVNPNSSIINPTVNATRQRCKKLKCYGFAASSFSQWSDLLTTFVAPAIGLLIVCPIGSPGYEDDDQEEEEEEADPESGEGNEDSNEANRLNDTERVVEATEIVHDGNVDKSASVHTSSQVQTRKEYLYQRSPMPGKKRKRGWHGFIYIALEYISLIGDPSSAIAGSLHQLFWDMKVVKALCSVKDYYSSKEVYEDALRLALLCGQTAIEEVDSMTKKRGTTSVDEYELSRIFTPEAPITYEPVTKEPPTDEAMTDEPLTDEPLTYEPTSNQTARSERPLSISSQFSRDSTFSWSKKRDSSSVALLAHNALKGLPDWVTDTRRSKIRRQLDDATGTVLKAKIDFTNGIVVPVVLAYAGCAAGFYTAYQALGNRDKAFTLSFGVSYAWLLVLAVVSNSSAITVNSSLLEPLLASLLYDASHPPSHHTRKGSLSFHIRYKYWPRVVPFRRRISTTAQWSRWIDEILAKTSSRGIDVGSPVAFHHFHSQVGSYASHFLKMQILGWLCASVFVACGAIIAWKTPTLGLGCRSFTLFLYMFLTLVTSFMHWLRVIFEVRGSSLTWLLNCLYRTSTFSGAFAIVGGTAAQLIGLFQRCSCSALFQGENAIVVLNTNTQQDIDSAKNFWLPVGYVAFMIALLLSSGAVILREYIFMRLTARFLQIHE
jgi:hypothetical protein